MLQAAMMGAFEDGQLDTADERLAEKFVNDKKNAALDRYQVKAMLLDVKLSMRKNVDRDQEWKERLKNAESLVAQFPELEESYGYLYGIAKAFSKAERKRIYKRLLKDKATPSRFADLADREIKRMDLESTVLRLPGIDLSHYWGKPLVIYTWTSEQMPPSILKIGDHLSDNVQFLGINVEAGGNDQSKLMIEGGYPGSQFFDGEGGVVSEALYLNKPGNVILLDESGTVTDVFGIEDLNRKLAEVGGFIDQFTKLEEEMGGAK